MKRQYLFISLGIVFLGLIFSAYQYYNTFKLENVSAVTVGIPNPGHSWASMECSSDTLCIDNVNKYIGIGTSSPVAALDVNGAIKVGSQATCNTAAGGAIRYNSTVKEVEFCNGRSWDSLSWSCGTSVTFKYNGSFITYGTVLSPSGRCWLDRNLGASGVATSLTDANAYGDLFQWGRLADGHQLRTSTLTTTLSTTDVPGNNLFITNTDYGTFRDWRVPQNNNLWQGVSGINNPCPLGWKIPTVAEWQAEIAAGSWSNYNTAYASPLKLTPAGSREEYAGGIVTTSTVGYYWSSGTVGLCPASGTCGDWLLLNAGSASCGGQWPRANGMSVRCIKN